MTGFIGTILIVAAIILASYELLYVSDPSLVKMVVFAVILVAGMIAWAWPSRREQR